MDPIDLLRKALEKVTANKSMDEPLTLYDLHLAFAEIAEMRERHEKVMDKVLDDVTDPY